MVVFDPPTYSNSKRTEDDWEVQNDSVPLLQALLPLVRKGGVIYFSNNFRRFKFDPIRTCGHSRFTKSVRKRYPKTFATNAFIVAGES